MEDFLIKFMRTAMWLSMIGFPLGGLLYAGMTLNGNLADVFLGYLAYATLGLIIAAFSFGIVAILLKIEQNTRIR